MKSFGKRFRKNKSKEFFDQPLPRIFAHRGLALVHPENTIEAFQHAIAIGVEYIESDIQVTKDGIPVLFHDDDLKRAMGISAKIRNLMNNTLVNYHFRTGEAIPTLEETLRILPHARFNLDVKSSGAAIEIATIIVEAQAQHRILLTSFSKKRRDAVFRAIRYLSPNNLPVKSASQSEFLTAFLGFTFGVNWIARRAMKDIQAVQIPIKVLFLRFDTASLIKKFHDIGVEVHYWTINDSKEMTRLVQLGADGIVSDRPDLYQSIT